MSKQIVKLPDIGSDQAAQVVELLVAVGDTIESGQDILVLETDKASVEVPSDAAGTVVALLVAEGDEIKVGAPLLELSMDTVIESESVAEPVAPAAVEPIKPETATSSTNTPEETSVPVYVPDIGQDEAEVVEVLVTPGDELQEGDSLLVLESDKASMELPSPSAGRVTVLLVKEGDKVKQGQTVAELQSASEANDPVNEPQVAGNTVATKTAASTTQDTARQAAAPAATAPAATEPQAPTAGGATYAGPAVRKLARELGIEFSSRVKASGLRGRYTKEDLRRYVRELITQGGSGLPTVPPVDHARFGTVKRVKMSRIKKLTAANMQRSWLNVPHVTQFDEADISQLEAYRKSLKAEAEKRGSKLSPLPFILKACALTLKEEPSFNVSLDADGEHIIEKQYVHIGVAVDTPLGLMVPVIRDVDEKDLWQLAEECASLAAKAREGKLKPAEMQGGCFTVSSLGAIGGQGFTPIVNTPEVGILGVSRASIKPRWDGKSFVPSTMLPLSLSYDHRAVNGADAGRFLSHLVGLLAQHESLIVDRP